MPFLGNAVDGSLTQSMRSDLFTLGPVAAGDDSFGRPFAISGLPLVAVRVTQTAGAGGALLQVWGDRTGSWFLVDVITLPLVINSPITVVFDPIVLSEMAFVLQAAGGGAITTEEATVFLSATAYGARTTTMAIRPDFG